jgi:FkbM family methyltransferase
MRIKLRHFNKYIFSRLGLQIVPFDDSISIEGLVHRLHGLGLDFSIIYDIGAHQGYWTKNLARWMGKDAQFFLFEPNTMHNEKLKQLNYSYFNYLLGDVDYKDTSFYAVGNTGDSYYKEINPVYDLSAPTKMQIRTLDSLILEHSLPFPDFIKLDTQGSELDILRGATNSLKKVKLVVAELPIGTLNPGSPGIEEFLIFMEESGFTPVALVEIHTLLDILIQIDIAFLRNEEFEKIYGHRNPYLRKTQ